MPLGAPSAGGNPAGQMGTPFSNLVADTGRLRFFSQGSVRNGTSMFVIEKAYSLPSLRRSWFPLALVQHCTESGNALPDTALSSV